MARKSERPTFDPGDARFFVEGNRLVVEYDEVLPPRCIRTNLPVTDDEMVTKTIYYVPWYLYLVLFAGLLPACVVILLLRKPLKITYGINSGVRWRGIFGILGSVVMFIAGIVGSIALIGSQNDTLIAWGVGVLVLGILSIFGALFFQTAPRITRHDDGLFYLKGCCPEYLATIEDEIEWDNV